MWLINVTVHSESNHTDLVSDTENIVTDMVFFVFSLIILQSLEDIIIILIVLRGVGCFGHPG